MSSDVGAYKMQRDVQALIRTHVAAAQDEVVKLAGRVKQMYVIGWDFGKSSTAVQKMLRPLTKREKGSTP